jgi:hypothetical protein
MFSHHVAKLINLVEADPEIGEHVIAELEWAYFRVHWHSDFFRVLVEPALDGLENPLMLPTRDPSLLAGGATVLDDAALAALV